MGDFKKLNKEDFYFGMVVGALLMLFLVIALNNEDSMETEIFMVVTLGLFILGLYILTKQ